MKRLKIVIVIGTRPEAIKLFPIIRELQKYPEQFEKIIISTGQHQGLLQQTFNFFDIHPTINFQVMRENQTLAGLTSKLIPKLTDYFLEELPGMIIIQGDTTSALCSTIAAYYSKCRISHVEAGLRTHLLFNPFPEEANRRMISACSGYHFAPTQIAKQNLLKENIPEKQIFVTGNPIIDTLEYMTKYGKIKINKEFQEDIKDRVFLLVTIHRRENFGEPMQNIRLALEKIAETSKKFQIIFPLHPNPNVQEIFKDFGKGFSNIHVIPPLSYPDFLSWMKASFLILTDSGGVLEEASYFGKPVLILREVTERPESVNAHIARIIGTRTQDIYQIVLHYYSCPGDYRKMAVEHKFLYGDGTAAQKIVKLLPELCDENNS